jgi:hypothetical protein
LSGEKKDRVSMDWSIKYRSNKSPEKASPRLEEINHVMRFGGKLWRGEMARMKRKRERMIVG